MAAQQHSKGMRPVLAVEQTHRLNRITANQANESISFAVIKTEDEHISLCPTLQQERGVYYSLNLSSCKLTDFFIIEFKLVLGRNCSLRTNTKQTVGDLKSPLVKEAIVLMGPGDSSQKKVMAFRHPESDSFFPTPMFPVCTLLVHVYTMAQEASHHLNRARLSDHLCDVKLEVDGVELRAHRTVLAVRSPVLERMLVGDFKEAHECRVQIVDFSKKVVENFLHFLYTDQIQDWGNSELELLQIADKYMVPELRNECLRRLRTCDDGPRALELLSAAVDGGPGSEFIDSTLRRRLTTIVLNNMGTLAATKQWEDFKEAHPILVDIMYGSAATSSAPTTTFTTLSPQLCILFDENEKA